MKKITKSRLIVMRNNKLLVLKRNTPKLRYSLIGGIIKKSESSKEGLIREAKEEANVVLKKNDIRFIYGHTYIKEAVLVKKKYYLLKQLNGYNFQLNETHKFDDLVWVNILEAIKYMRNKERNLIETHLLKI